MFKNVFKRNLSEINLMSLYHGHHKVTYRGIKAIRCPLDYVLYQMLIFEQKPDLIIEIGTNAGGGALYLADLLEIIGKGIVHTIDIKNSHDPMIDSHPRIKTFFDGWQGYYLNLASGFEKILIIEDGSHTYEDSLGALKKFSPLVNVGSYFVVEDGIIDDLGLKNKYNGGPLRAIEEFLKNNNSFLIDRKYCDLFGKNATFNVNGYLKKVSDEN